VVCGVERVLKSGFVGSPRPFAALVLTFFMVNIADVTADEASPQTHQVLAAPRRAELLALLRARSEPLTVVQAAEAVGLHANTTRLHLDRLVQIGLAERVTEQRTRPGRPRALYRANRPSVDPGDDSYRALAGVLADGLAATKDPGRAAIEAGERWVLGLDERPAASPGQGKPVVIELQQLLDQLGFEPELDLPHGVIRLHRCPFAEVARGNRTVVCGVHLGMLRATLRRLGAATAHVQLESFVTEEPLLCLVHLDPPTRAEPPPRSRAGRRVS
jgi:predicted ArsR family transcriptional regulator